MPKTPKPRRLVAETFIGNGSPVAKQLRTLAHDPAVQVINLSFGGGVFATSYARLADAVRKAWLGRLGLTPGIDGGAGAALGAA